MTDKDHRAKVSVSMPDDLKERTETYAQQHTLSFSDVVRQALERFLDNTPAPVPSPPPEPLPSPPIPGPSEPTAPNDLATLQNYVLQIAVQHENLRESLQRAGLASCYPLPRPPWLDQRHPDSAWPPQSIPHLGP